MADRLFAIVVAAGSGSRFGSDLPKQFCTLDGEPVLVRTLRAVRDALPGASLTVVVSENMSNLWSDLCATFDVEPHTVVIGGKSRMESVSNALTAIERRFGSLDAGDLVAVHDGARPLLSPPVGEGLLAALTDPSVEGAVPAVTVTDSLRRLASDHGCDGSEAVDRSLYRAVQTPQIFRGDLLARAYRQAAGEADKSRFTDDASVMEQAGFTHLRLTPGATDNIKITNPFDLAIASLLLSART